jgi:hypothetical protein
MLFSFVVLTIAVALATAVGLVHAKFAIGLICSFLAVALIAIGTTNRGTYLGRLHRSSTSTITFVVLFLPCLWMMLQAVPVAKAGLVNTVWSSTSNALGFPIVGSVTIDTGATLVALVQYCAALATAGVLVALAFDRRVAELTLYLLTFAAVSAAAFRIAYSLAPPDLAQLFATANVSGLSILAAIGITLACATEIRLHERLRSRRSKPESRPRVIVGLACGVLSLAICTLALLIEANIMLLFAGFFGAGILMAIFVTRQWSLSVWGQSGVIAVLGIILFAFLAAAQPKRETNLAETSLSQSQAVVDRMLSDAPALGSGAGTFETLLPVYREFDHAQLQKSDVAAALITIEMGRTFLWISVLALTCAAAVFARGGVARGRDYVYASAGAGVVVVALFLIFVSSDLLSLPVSVFLGAITGLAWAQRRSANENSGSAGSNVGQFGTPSSKGDSRDAPIRFAFVLAGLILTAEAAWLLLAERHGSGVVASPFVDFHQVTIDQRDRVQEAATIASVRGDLWAETAFAGAALSLTTPANRQNEEETRGALIRALRYAPYRSDVWLTFALLAETHKWQGVNPKALLKMAYYTGPNEANLIPARVKAALHLIGGVADPELQDMIRADVSFIFRRLPALRPILIDAYKSGTVESRTFEEGLIAELDPNYLKDMRSQ